MSASPTSVLLQHLDIAATSEVPRYLTATELRNWKVRCQTVDFGVCVDSDLETEIIAAEANIDQYVGTYFDSRTGTIYLDGNGTHLLSVAGVLSAPIQSVTSLQLLDTDGVTVKETLTEGTDFFVQGWSLEKPFDRFKNTSSSSGNDDRSHWIRGPRRYKLTGVFGPATVPTLVKKATALLAIEALRPGYTGMCKSGVFIRKFEDFTEQRAMGVAEPIAAGETTGYDLTDRLLSGYVVQPDMFMDLTGDFARDLPDPSPMTDFTGGISFP